MSSLYDVSVGSYLQITRSVATVMQKGQEYAQANNIDLATIVDTRLREDMAPFSFQIYSVAHHSLGAINALGNGEFRPPQNLGLDYAGLQGLVQETISGLEALDSAAVNDLASNSLNFVLGDNKIPFQAENFILTFSLPNFYFHATTTYDILRMLGVPLGKMDFLGQMRMG